MHRQLRLALPLLASSKVFGLSASQQVLRPLGTSEAYDVRHELIKAEIIPTVVDDFLPALRLTVNWSSKTNASLGNTLKPKKLDDAPSVTLQNLEFSSERNANMTYVIALTDPDAPSRDNPEWSEFCHWIAYGLTVSSSAVHDGRGFVGLPASPSLNEVISYKAPSPPEKTGKHRYVFLAFVPANGTTEKLVLSKPDDRKHWGTGKERHGVRGWASDNGLVPVAANFIYAQNKKQ